ncbi:MAG: hypothetical protein NZ899_14715 [Thermoguttaceae bacterium]|nr:hypothetical protein [Thermoguttaceae bacterium]MDW8079553.1 hypothetical protein [Thermoguttaceae bacterium]
MRQTKFPNQIMILFCERTGLKLGNLRSVQAPRSPAWGKGGPVAVRLAALAIALFGGCRVFTPAEETLPIPPLPNPLTVASRDPYVVWETLVDVLNDYFEIEYEEPVRISDGVITEGRVDTYPKVGATLLEPWRKDSVGRYERWYATLQSIRRRATAQVAPSPQGFRIYLTVVKELEDVPPGGASHQPASFRNDSSLTRVSGPTGAAPASGGWIPAGRDFLLEQRILNELAARLGTVPSPATSTPPIETVPLVPAS